MPAIDMAKTLNTVLHQLQGDPIRYRLFGIYWWPVKLLLKRAGYGRHQLYLLGDYQDAGTADLVPRMNLQDTMTAALEEFRRNAIFPHAGGMVESPDGEMVRLFDQDAGM